MLNLITNFFLFIIQVETNDIFKYLSIFETLENKNKIRLVVEMRSNFGRFWNVIEKKHPESQIELIDVFISNFNNIFGNSNDVYEFDICKKTLFDLINKLVKYSDNIDLVKFIKKFYNLDEDESIELIKNKDDKNSSFNFKHNIGMFWLGLTNANKNKLLTLIDKFFDNLNGDEKNIVFNRVKNNKTNLDLTIDLFDECKPNVIKINSFSHYENLIQVIEEKETTKGVSINTLILDNINLEGKQIELPFQITNIKIKNCKIKNLDYLHNGVVVLDCVSNLIGQLDNLPLGLKILLCGNNNIEQLNNLPKSLEYLDCHSNKIETFKSLPISLKCLKCSYNYILNLDNLPNNLIYLDCYRNEIESIENLPHNLIFLSCSKNKIKSWTLLPITLNEFICKSNLINIVGNLPLGLTRLNLSNNYIKKIYSLNSNIVELNLFDNKQIVLYDIPNMIETIYHTNDMLYHDDKLRSINDNYV
jgi:hypothetical protein